MLRSSMFVFAVTVLVSAAGCAKKPAARSPEALEVTAAHLPRANVHVADDLAAACKLHFGDVARAPKFDFDDDTLLPEDRAILEQIATCVTTGPLKGSALQLVGRADPRGESEYNLVLGEQRADSVKEYLAALGVAPERIGETSRGEMDALGMDEEGWKRDRRVDIALAK